MADMTFKAKLLPFADLNDSYTLGSSSKRWKIFGDLTGNAATATKLATARTLTIGSTGKTFDGSGNVSWSHAEIGATVSNTWTAGTTAGPTIKTTVNGVAGTAVAIPSASKTASGIVTTGDQDFKGRKGFGYVSRYGRTDTGGATRWVADTFLYNDAGTQVGEFWYDCGDATNITTGQYVWSQYSPNSTANTSTTGKKENYKLPIVASGLTENKSYNIITTKNPGDLYWANINVANSSSTTTEPTFGLIRSTKNSNTTTIGSQNANFCHIYNSANIPFIFNNTIATTSGSLGNTSYPFANLYMGPSNGAGIYYKGTKSTYRMIRFIDNTTDTYGNGISIGGGGQTIIGGGESADTAVAQAGTAGAESMWICNDGAIEFYPNLQNGWTTSYKNYIDTSGYYHGIKIYGAVWNDYAEYRKDNPNEIQEPGRCVKELGNGALALTTKRLERGCEIISDTFGFAIGQDEENGYNTPIASNGRVLAYPYEAIEEFANHIGWPVCSGPNGTVSIMTEEEEEKYPSRIIGTISEIPTYEEWGTGNVKVNGRVWIRIK